MKKCTKSLLLALAVVLTGWQLGIAQNVIQIEEGHDKLLDAYEQSQPGDIIELTTSGGLYTVSGRLENNHPITVRAAEGLEEKPVITDKSDRGTVDIFRLHDDLTLRGLEIDGMAPDSAMKYAIRTDYVSSEDNTTKEGYVLKVYDSYFHDIVAGSDGNVFRAYDFTLADSVIFHDVVIENTGKQAIRFLDAGYDRPDFGFYNVEYFEMTNSTVAKTRKEGIGIYGGDDDPSTEGPTIRIDHVTFDSAGYEDSRAIYPWEVDDTKITNVIITNSPGGDAAVKLYGPDALMSHVDTMNVTDFDQSRDATIENVYAEDPMYRDPLNHDYTLAEDSPVLTLGLNGGALGDPRWLPGDITNIEDPDEIPEQLSLGQNYPNPFNPTTTIPYKLDRAEEVTLKVYNTLGHEVATLVDGRQQAGSHQVTFDASNLSSGIYLYTLKVGNEINTKKMILLK